MLHYISGAVCVAYLTLQLVLSVFIPALMGMGMGMGMRTASNSRAYSGMAWLIQTFSRTGCCNLVFRMV